MISDRPLFIFDLETTGVEPATDRIVQIAYQRDMQDGSEPVKRCRLINPERPIPVQATAIHRITDEMVSSAPTFRQVAKSLHAAMEGCDLAGYNIAGFDIELLWEEFHRAGVEWDVSQHRIIDGLAIWRAMQPRKLIDAIEEFCIEDEVNPINEEELHDAAKDVEWTAKVIVAQFHRLPVETALNFASEASKRTIEIDGETLECVDLAGVIARRGDGTVVYTHRKVRGLPVIDDRKYGGWILHNDGFSENTKQHLRRALGLTPECAK